ncbi:hypothetical protein BU26DRAFT_517760 [Trematosphaeria pertusa]|uniref:NAD(P)-binding protein n=1 Tax=Trematosphaeria pertusa TaxID=390896 RepID=A0A6A6IMG5_9PLEO|nr:uncharacterized protein BU26DRAFT_517760 [Trematosphaeria pertusa]KAF2251012.1 hypothetical protein BU26DRAFT_517760 [Trematosphaeria pertusa]
MEREVDLLILGAGWTSTFLIPLLDKEGVPHAETTTAGRDGTIPFKFEPNSSSTEPYTRLPAARTILITFPLTGHNQSSHLTSLYRKTHGTANHWIQLGSTGIFNKLEGWNDETSPYDASDARAIAEDELRECVGGCVLNLAGLYGGKREPKNWVPRIAKTKEDVRKRKAVHFVHGEDVARTILLTHRKFTPGKRWIITDLRVYDWYDLIMSFSALAEGEEEVKRKTKLKFVKWVGELMIEEGVRALPRSVESLGRVLDSRAFWETHECWPGHPRLA